MIFSLYVQNQQVSHFNTKRMYVIINKTKRTKRNVSGDFPNLEEELNNGDALIVISFYSWTIKTPYAVIENGVTYWEWKDSPLENSASRVAEGTVDHRLM